MVAVTRYRFDETDDLTQRGLVVADQLRRDPRNREKVTYFLDIASTIEERAEGESTPLFDDENGWIS
jgi:hypothetical protein